MSDDGARLLAGLTELCIRADALTAGLSAHHEPRSRYSGADRNGLARVSVDGHGRTTEVVVAPEWRQRADPAGLARALLEAAAEAQAGRLAAVATGAVPATTALLDRTPAATPLDGFGAELIRRLLPLLESAERQLDEGGRRIAHHFTENARLKSPAGECTITARGGDVTEIKFDGRWIASAGAEEVARQVCQLFQEAHDRAFTGIGDLLPQELRDLVAFTAEPERMLRRLGSDVGLGFGLG